MDLDGLFWIALIVFYFLARMIGGGKRSNQTGKSQPRGPRRDTSREGSDELSVALDEIRQALGYPDAEDVEPATAAEAPQASRPEQGPKDGRVSAPTPATLPTEHRRSSDRVRTGTRRSPDHPKQRTKKQQTTRRTKPRMRSSSIKKKSRPEVGDKIVPGLPTLESSFSEEDTFERVGRHPHRTTRHDLRVVSPYEEPARKQLPGLRRRLAKRASLREAFLIKEILDRPVSMREP